MRRTAVLGVVAAVLAGAGCRSACGDHCDNHGPLMARVHEAPVARPAAPDCGCAPGYPASARGTLPPAGWVPDPGFGYPIYPGGSPVPLSPGVGAPANELPYPTIPAPGVPENPAQPIPAIPSSTARTTAEPKQK